jgi:hypothetical protein
MYLANDVVQNSRRKGPEYVREDDEKFYGKNCFKNASLV